MLHLETMGNIFIDFLKYGIRSQRKWYFCVICLNGLYMLFILPNYEAVRMFGNLINCNNRELFKELHTDQQHWEDHECGKS